MNLDYTDNNGRRVDRLLDQRPRADVDIYEMVAERDSIMKMTDTLRAQRGDGEVGRHRATEFHSARSDCSSAATRRSRLCSISLTRTESRVFVSSSIHSAPHASSFSMKQAR